MKITLKSLLFISFTLSTVFTASAASFTLTSPDFTSGHLMPPAMGGNLPHIKSCHGQNISPPLVWENPPAATQSFALIIQDAEGRNGLGATHLLAYGIPATQHQFLRTALANGQGFIGGKNSFGKPAYNGPCLPANSDTHVYTFTLIATNLPADALEGGLTQSELLQKLDGHALAAAGMFGLFSGKK